MIRTEPPAEETQKKAASWAEAILAAPAGMAILDSGNRIIDVNLRFAEATGYSRDELTGRALSALFPPGPRQAQGPANPETTGGDYRLRRKDGSFTDVRFSAGGFAAPDGTSHRIAVLTDISAEKRREERTRLTEKMEAVSRLAGGAAHGFNNLLTIITGYDQLLRNALDEADPVQAYVAEIGRAAENAAILAAKLLAFSHRRIGDPELQDLNDLARRSAVSFRAGLPPAILVATDLCAGPLPIRADRAYLEQAVRELLVNSLEALQVRGPAAGRITVRTLSFVLEEEQAPPVGDLQPGSYALVEVEDTGEGIDPETKKHIFEPFYSTRSVGRGTGLATVYGTLRQCGGDVKVTSTRGQGTVVTLFLPVAGADAE